ncbi:MAG: CDP-diacylglycerol--glycerol-3-phosphate 3-phosphatidyltransferase [Chlamydiales bacterium]|nr:CDP-diacylglycerol--glycerol-3-phosphate 3-phosphatidyltransferase [Chlamydiales bacterium]MCH9636200.1 CDP-diacylglycerol--glycerol-3-phosphate 3-phosphatidyltransferase [Chlamydiales bacterium]MCH9703353.1 CDP-alcohol phosphatidyltransferase family protein [Chlamydiota bacterium]
MLNFSNVLSLSRAGFALLFLIENVYVRLAALLCAMLSDFFDGYLARKQNHTTHFGAILDPVMDKFFVFFVAGIFFMEDRLVGWEFGALISRDVSLVIFAVYLMLAKKWKGYECKALMWGKVTTVAQFFLLLGLTLNYVFPGYVYFIFIALAIFAFVELFTRLRKVH